MKTYIKIIYIILALIFAFILIFGINIIPKQMAFDNSCKEVCLLKGFNDHEITTFSYPWNNVNGKCYCKNETQINNFNGVSRDD